MLREIESDLRRHLPAAEPFRIGTTIRLLVEDFGFQAILVYRFGEWLSSKRTRPASWSITILLYPIYWGLERWVRLAYDICLRSDAKIGAGFYVGHFGGIRISRCSIGENCSIHQQVHILPKDALSGLEGPTIGSNVWIGAHARIYGPVTIGDGTAVGAGATVETDIPARCLVLGNPARVVQREFDNSSILSGNA